MFTVGYRRARHASLALAYLGMVGAVAGVVWWIYRDALLNPVPTPLWKWIYMAVLTSPAWLLVVSIGGLPGAILLWAVDRREAQRIGISLTEFRALQDRV